jgi:hypothetical protein
MAGVEIVPGLIYVKRKEWVVNTTLPPLGATVPRKARTHVFIHHTVTPDGDSTPNEWETEEKILKRMQSLQTIRPDLGLDVPYNFVAFLFDTDKLVICEGRGPDKSGAHTKGHNTKAIAVSFAGNFEDLPVDKPALETRMRLLSAFLGWLKSDSGGKMSNIDSFKPQGRNVWFHSDVKATACPGDHLEAVLGSVTFGQRA